MIDSSVPTTFTAPIHKTPDAEPIDAKAMDGLIEIVISIHRYHI